MLVATPPPLPHQYTRTLTEMSFERGLWSAAVDGDISKCAQLIESGRDVNETDSSGYTALVSFSCEHVKYIANMQCGLA